MLIPRKTDCRILLIEDNLDHRDLITDKLRKISNTKIVVHYYPFAGESLDHIEKRDFDVILLAISLPENRAGETLKRFAQAFPTLPIIVLTSVPDPVLIENAMAWGAQDYLDKTSLKSEVIARSVHHAISRKRVLNRLESQNQALRAFSHTVAHEVKSPLQSVVTALYMVREMIAESGNKRLDRMIHLGIESTAHLKLVVNGLLSFAEFESEKESHQPVAVEPLIREVFHEAHSLHDMSNVKLLIGGELPVIRGSLQVRQVFSNLIANAIKYRKSSPLEVMVECRKDGAFWEFAVRDNGIGISRENLGKIFTLFYRAKEDERIQGTGIGLAFSKQIIERTGGKMWVESTHGHGSTFFFTIPWNE